MKKLVRVVIPAIAVLATIGVFLGARYQPLQLMAVFTGGAAKLMCSAVFAGGRDEQSVREQEFNRRSSPGKYLGLARLVVDEADKAVSATLFGLASRKAIFRDGVGCTATEGISERALRAQGSGGVSGRSPPPAGLLWPEGSATLLDVLPPDIDEPRLTSAVAKAFVDPDSDRPLATRAVLVVHGGRIIAEQYAEGFTTSTGHLSNSVAKTFTNALVGILVAEGILDIHARAPIVEWADPDDPRHAITLHDLLLMQSGLEFEENYVSINSDTTMMYVGGDLAGFAAAKPLEVPPGSRWQYSTGTSNILGRIVSEAAGEHFEQRLSFPRRKLFEPLNMRHSVFEVDGAGNFIGGSSVFASARDYARLALLYLRDGMVGEIRVLPQGWMEYTRTPAENVPPGFAYGAQLWLNSNDQLSDRRWPSLPPDTFAMLGHQEQNIMVIPSLDLIVVRLGLTEFGNWDIQVLVGEVMQSLSQ